MTQDIVLRSIVRQQLMNYIAKMDLAYSTRLLSENQLAEKLGVSRSTVRSVLAELESEGIVSRRHGSGTYVNPQAAKAKTTLGPCITMYDSIAKGGHVPEWKFLLKKTLYAGKYASALELHADDTVVELHSCYYADGLPSTYCVDVMDAKHYEGVNSNKIEGFIWSANNYLRNIYNLHSAWDVISVQGTNSTERKEVESFFGSKEIPLVKLVVTNFNIENRPVLLGFIYVDTEITALTMVRELLHK